MAVADGHHRQIGPARIVLRLRAAGLGQFQLQRVQKAELLQEGALPFAADQLRDPRGADVGRVDEDILDRHLRAVVMVIADREAAKAQRAARVDHRIAGDQPQFQRLRQRKGLHHRAQLIQPLHRTVEQRRDFLLGQRGRRRGAVIGIEHRGRGQRHDLAGVHIHQNGRAADGVEHVDAARQHLFDDRLHAQIQRQRDRHIGQIGIAQTLVQVILDPRHALNLGGCHALLAVSRAAQHMRGQRAVGIKPHVALAQQQARLTDVMRGLLLLRRQARAQPDEAAVGIGQLRGQPLFVHIGENPRQFMRGARAVDHVAQLGIERMRDQIGRQHPPVAVQNIGPLARDTLTDPRLGLDHRGGGQHAHLGPDRGVSGKERRRQKQDAPFRPPAAHIADLFAPDAQVLALDALRVHALRARIQNARQGTKRGARRLLRVVGHSEPSVWVAMSG